VYLYAPLSDVEPDAVQQLIKVAEAGIATGYVSAMPDVHLGMPMQWTACLSAVGSGNW
jgi:RNA-splicing ligase RtcB